MRFLSQLPKTAMVINKIIFYLSATFVPPAKSFFNQNDVFMLKSNYCCYPLIHKQLHSLNFALF